jgi:hypothetical protein
MASRKKLAQRIAELTHEDVAVRRKAALKLGEYGDHAALPELCAALRDESWKVARNAAKALSSFRDPAAVEALSSVFIVSPRKKKYRSVRKEALLALGDIGTEAAIETIGRVWREERDLHDVAPEALLRAGLPAVPILCRALAEGYAALLPQLSRLHLTVILVRHSLIRLHGGPESAAYHVLCSLLEARGVEVFAALLATDRLSPREKYACLEALRRRWRYMQLTVYFRDVPGYCQHWAATDEREAVRAGARAVLDYITLPRGSQRPLTTGSDELLRAGSGMEDDVGSDVLLRASDDTSKSLDARDARLEHRGSLSEKG